MGMHVNVRDTAEAIEALIRSGRAVDPGRLADPSVPLESVWPALRRDGPRGDALTPAGGRPGARTARRRRR